MNKRNVELGKEYRQRDIEKRLIDGMKEEEREEWDA